MQTFLPYPSFAKSAEVLDYRRLGKQRVEAMQLLGAIDNGGGWANHPAARMWREHRTALILYGIEICLEWKERGYRDNLYNVFIGLWMDRKDPLTFPEWLGNPAFHSSHRSNLLRKDPVWYGQFGWTEGPELPYIWPVRTLDLASSNEGAPGEGLQVRLRQG